MFRSASGTLVPFFRVSVGFPSFWTCAFFHVRVWVRYEYYYGMSLFMRNHFLWHINIKMVFLYGHLGTLFTRSYCFLMRFLYLFLYFYFRVPYLYMINSCMIKLLCVSVYAFDILEMILSCSYVCHKYKKLKCVLFI